MNADDLEPSICARLDRNQSIILRGDQRRSVVDVEVAVSGVLGIEIDGRGPADHERKLGRAGRQRVMLRIAAVGAPRLRMHRARNHGRHAQEQDPSGGAQENDGRILVKTLHQCSSIFKRRDRIGVQAERKGAGGFAILTAPWLMIDQ